ncbi:MAG: hypothetical protein BV456_09920 [Thermoplasmata archaeon M8B2D]|nr:MAG: hypothetical protein BV456_09920 [Thermoplasmata archaeon M8B2D]
MDGLFLEIITKEMAILAGAAMTIMLFVGKIPISKLNEETKLLNQTKIWKNFGIFILLIVCLGGSFIPGIRPDGQWGNAVVFGLLSAFCAHMGKKVLGPLVLNKLEGKK